MSENRGTSAVIETNNLQAFYRNLQTTLRQWKLTEASHQWLPVPLFHRRSIRAQKPTWSRETWLNPALTYGKGKKASYVYLTATPDAAIWGAELSIGEGPGRIYIVEPTDPIEDDPNLTDKKYSGNPTKSYRSRDPLRVAGEVKVWQGHSPEQLKAMKEHPERLKQLGIEAIEDRVMG